MDERVKVLLHTLVASAPSRLAVSRFPGTTDEYAATLNIESTAHLTPREPDGPGNEVVDDPPPIDPSLRRPAFVEGPRVLSPVEPVSRMDERLTTRRREGLECYLLQRRVPEDLMRFPESS